MKRLISYQSISQFRNVVKLFRLQYSYIGKDEKGKAKYDPLIKFPTIPVICTEKIHGTHGALCYSKPDGFWVQSRENILTPLNDNAGCAAINTSKEDVWMNIIYQLADEYNIDLDTKIVSIYFEWCGEGIQKRTAVSGIGKKLAIIFSYFKVSSLIPLVENPNEEPAEWFPTKVGGDWIRNNENNIYNINDFPTYVVNIDFENPLMSQNELIEIVTGTIETGSPVGKHFGLNTIGEGLVASIYNNGVLHQFKCKGIKHSKSHVTTLKPVDNEKLQKIQEIAQLCAPSWRLEQMFDLANDTINGNLPDITNMGAYMKLINNDIIKEELDIITDAGLVPKDIFKSVSIIARAFYSEMMDEAIMK